ncbi:hypothetical protein L1987_17127 [Smallanthus sonchifolius]|uniref:Uncharacterized protein n=1 Tax=Smallanthus sonchifolius TaxID=185202 RepID=A0ACB9IWX2_9ASTR|nr:hypothetical protein L1987_17127 [Smallanthus sonchifolius]
MEKVFTSSHQEAIMQYLIVTEMKSIERKSRFLGGANYVHSSNRPGYSGKSGAHIFISSTVCGLSAMRHKDKAMVIGATAVVAPRQHGDRSYDCDDGSYDYSGTTMTWLQRDTIVAA